MSGMKLEHWIIAAGTIFAIGVIAASSLPDMFWSDNNTSPISSQVTHLGGIISPAQPAADIPVANPQQKDAITGLVPFTKAKTIRFRGRVIRVISLGNNTGWGQMHVWIDDGNGESQEISIAPDWYLVHMGCNIKEKSKVEGTAFTFGKPRVIPELYAKSITVGRKTCRLRNDEGFALWSNRLR